MVSLIKYCMSENKWKSNTKYIIVIIIFSKQSRKQWYINIVKISQSCLYAIARGISFSQFCSACVWMHKTDLKKNETIYLKGGSSQILILKSMQNFKLLILLLI